MHSHIASLTHGEDEIVVSVPFFIGHVLGSRTPQSVGVVVKEPHHAGK
jgi:hypothetical protein